MKIFLDVINESKGIEVNIDFSKDEKSSFLKKAEKEKISVKFGKNKYAETAQLTGDVNKIQKFLNKYGYSKEEMKII